MNRLPAVDTPQKGAMNYSWCRDLGWDGVVMFCNHEGIDLPSEQEFVDWCHVCDKIMYEDWNK